MSLSESFTELMMKFTPENKRQVVSYLFGEMSPDARDEYEEKIFLSEDFSLFVNDVENDLIDEYVSGELESRWKEKFESVYLVSETRQEKIRNAKAFRSGLLSETSENDRTIVETKRSIWSFASSLIRIPTPALAGGLAIVLVLVIGGILFFSSFPAKREFVEVTNENRPAAVPATGQTPEKQEPNDGRSENKENGPENDSPVFDSDRRSVDPGENEQEKKQKNVPQNSPAGERNADVVPKPLNVLAFSLFPPLRSSERPLLKISPDARSIRLTLFDNFGKKYSKYLVELNDGGGNVLLSTEVPAGKQLPRRSITVSISAERFKTGAFEIAVRGVGSDGSVEDINFFSFVVEKKEQE